MKYRSGIPAIKLLNNETAITDSDKAEALNKYFSSVFTNEDLSNIPPSPICFLSDPITTIDFTPELVKEKLLSLNDNKSPGPDNIHPFLLKTLSHVLCVSISMLFELSIKTGTTANQWKEAIITAVYKKGSKNLAENYRPISLTSIIVKVMESFIRDAILDHMVNNNLFNQNQHGFVPQKNCTTQLLEAVEEWYDIIDRHGYIDVTYTDFAKAFDSVPHKRLIKKLNPTESKMISLSGLNLS